MFDSERRFEVFIPGETIDLVVPNERAIDEDGWYRWFNDPEVTRYSDYGRFPNTPEKQREYLRAALSPDSRRLVLLIQPSGETLVVGVASLSNISEIHRSAETAIVIGDRPTSAGALFWGIEAKARLVEHAFEVLGLERVGGAQAMPLADWQNYQVLFGFRPEGIKRAAHRRGHQVFDSVLSSCTLEDYLHVKQARAGHYWPGRAKLLELMRELPKSSIAGKVSAAIDAAVADHMRGVKLF
ncbi:MAG: N-acetyltransferase [Alphaproteobacteria bacterium]|nr:N-acetyltransferase [Alphaproteobacteria bacterium]